MKESKHLGFDVTLENLSSDDEDSRIRRVVLKDLEVGNASLPGTR